MRATTQFAAIAGLAITATAFAQTGLQGLGMFDAGAQAPSSIAMDVSADGTIVVGGSASFDPANPSRVLMTSFRWTSSTGMQMLRSSPHATFGGAGRITSDGSIIVGAAIGFVNGFGVQQAMSYSSASGFNLLGEPPGGQIGSWAEDVSDDGQIIVGGGYATGDGQPTAFKWTQATGLQTLPSLYTSSPNNGSARAISRDGTVIAGYSQNSIGFTQAVRWTSAGVASLGAIPNIPNGGSQATCMSHDGSVIAGWSHFGLSNSSKAFRWHQATGMVDLGNLSGFILIKPSSMSADGSIIVGMMRSASEVELAFVWDPSNGVQDLNTVAAARGVDLAGWTLIDASGISADGLSIVGQGLNPSGGREAFLLRLPAPPVCGTSDFNGDGDFGTDADIEAFFACLAGDCCPTCFSGASDFNGDGDYGTDADIESFFRVLGGGPC